MTRILLQATPQLAENQISKELINKVLDIYKDDYIFISNATRIERGILATLCVNSYPYTKNHTFNYVTAPSLSLITGQVCYVLMGDIIYYQRMDQLSDIEFERYLTLRDEGSLVFTKLNYKFKKKIPFCEFVNYSMQLHSIKRMRSLIIAKFEFSVPGYMHGETSLIASL